MKISLFYNGNSILKNKIHYVFETFLKFLDYDLFDNDKEIKIAYSKDKEGITDYDIIIFSGSNTEIFYTEKKEYNCNQVRYFKYNDKEIPLLFYSNNHETLYKVNEQKATVEIYGDIFASAFFFLSGWQEYVATKKDIYDRFCGKDSLQYKLDLIDIPIVNLYFEFLKNLLINHFNYKPNKKNIFDKKQFSIGISHDIDYIRKWTLGIIYREIVKLFILNHKRLPISERIIRLLHFFRAIIQRYDPYKISIEKILFFEQKMKIHSTFFFKSGGKTKHDISYSLNSSYLKRLIKFLKNNGFDIGLHPSFNAYNNQEMMKKERDKLSCAFSLEKIGVRNHFLRYNISSSGKIHSNLCFKYDSTLGFHDFEGFRFAYCLPYQLYDIIEDKKLDIWEIPLVVMDATLNDYRQFNKEQSLERINKIIQTIKEHNGCGVLLFHNTCYDDFDFKGWGEIYEKSIISALEHNAFIGSLNEIFDQYILSN